MVGCAEEAGEGVGGDGVKLSVKLAESRHEKGWVRAMVEQNHYLHQWPHPLARPFSYIATLSQIPVGLITVGIPHATRCRGWWGYVGLPTQWQVVDLCRIWLDPAVQFGGRFATKCVVPGFVDRKRVFRPTVASWLIDEVLQRVQRDRISYWPPKFPDEPYHIRLVISYHDPRHHRGTIYKLGNAEPLYVDEVGNPAPSSRGKFGWVWRLPEPDWAWNEIYLTRPRQRPLVLEI